MRVGWTHYAVPPQAFTWVSEHAAAALKAAGHEVVPWTPASRPDVDFIIAHHEHWWHKQENRGYNAPWAPILLLDHEPVGMYVATELERANAVICPTMYTLRKVSLRYPDKPAVYVPHAFDSRHFYRPAEPRVSGPVRVGYAKANSSLRPNFAGCFEAFAICVNRLGLSPKDVRLSIWADPSGRERREVVGMNLQLMAQRFSIQDYVDFPWIRGAPASALGDWYRSLDLHVSTCIGDGFGLTTIEAEACFPKGVSVAAARGHIPIESVQSGDFVLSHDGSRNRVLEALRREYVGIIATVTPHGSLPITSTAGHPWYIYKDGTEKAVRADSIRPGDLLCMPKESYIRDSEFQIESKPYEKVGRNQYGGEFFHPRTKRFGALTITDDVAELLGYYVSEGVATRGEIRFCFHRDETDYQNQVASALKGLGLESRVDVRDDNSAVVITSSSVLARLLQDQFGHRAHGKRLPSWALQLRPVTALRLLKGIWNGDGSFFIDRTKYLRTSYTTVSRSLAFDLRLLLLRFGVYGSISSDRGAYQVRVTGTGAELLSELLSRDMFSARTYRRRCYSFSETRGYVPVESVRHRLASTIVYNLRVSGQSSYTVDGFAVHNCGVPSLTVDWAAGAEMVPPEHRLPVGARLCNPHLGDQAIVRPEDVASHMLPLLADEAERKRWSPVAAAWAEPFRDVHVEKQWEAAAKALQSLTRSAR